MAPNTKIAISWLDIEEGQLDLVPFYLGGAKTLIAKANQNSVSQLVMGGGNSVGIRIPDNTFCNAVSAKFGKPITSTSVNRTNSAPLNDPAAIVKEFGSEIDLIVDAGTLPETKGSTIYRLNSDSSVDILRD